ncbi:hypothetical protein IMZ29_04155 [Achromobacter sp. GG226]|uniref:hypothetical protein n=1 Tax=Verticiella alkaliphila TaxID=2779529 RepID=UPI001C0D0ECF|nr:hypothetical protein [Verticiella sp. GG226]MBU4609768.1 hypothetical protein [Verticiella sp. GG226]
MSTPLRRYARRGIFALGLAFATSATAQTLSLSQFPAFELSESSRLIDLVRNVDAALDTNPQARSRHWRPVRDGSLPGIVDLQVQPRNNAAGNVANAQIAVQFANADAAVQFRAHLQAAVGAPDPACSDALQAHWALAPGQTLIWHESVVADSPVSLTLLDADAPDVNCAVHVEGLGEPFDPAPVVALLDTLQSHPLPWSDTPALTAWLARFGEVHRHGDASCPEALEVERPKGLPGVDHLALEIPSCSDADANASPVLHLVVGSADMFAAPALRKLFVTRHGDPAPACARHDQAAWAIDDTTHARWTQAINLGIVQITYEAKGKNPCPAPDDLGLL